MCVVYRPNLSFLLLCPCFSLQKKHTVTFHVHTIFFIFLFGLRISLRLIFGFEWLAFFWFMASRLRLIYLLQIKTASVPWWRVVLCYDRAMQCDAFMEENKRNTLIEMIERGRKRGREGGSGKKETAAPNQLYSSNTHAYMHIFIVLCHLCALFVSYKCWP